MTGSPGRAASGGGAEPGDDGERPGGGDPEAMIRPWEPAAPGAKVTRLELFYDLVFVYVFLNVTTVTAERLSPGTLLRSLLVLTLLWFAWSVFALLGNVVRADEGIVPLLGYATMATIFVLAVTLPETFGDRPQGLPGDLIFAFCYLLVRLLQVVGFRYAGRGDPRTRDTWRWLLLPVPFSAGLLILAAVVPQRLFDGGAELVAQTVLWLLAIAVEYVASALIRTENLTLVSAGHWADRHALIILIALGETILALGVGPGLNVQLPLTWSVIGASVFGVAIIAALWWAYFDALAIAAERVLHRTHGGARVALAREAYTYLHLPMIAGIILFALGLKRALTVITAPDVDVLGRIDHYVLYGGVLLYLLGLLGFQLRTVRAWNRFQWVPPALLAALTVVPHRLPAVAGLALLTLLTVGLLLVHGLLSRQPRRRLRQMKLAEQRALEAEETHWRRRHLERRNPPG